jgi:hypothetical protein
MSEKIKEATEAAQIYSQTINYLLHGIIYLLVG